MSEQRAVYKTAAFTLDSPVPAGSSVTQSYAEHVTWARANGWCTGPGKCPGGTYYYGGIDYAVPTGTPIQAAQQGKVTAAGWNNTGYGYHVRIDHGNGYVSLYAHLSELCVSVGQVVEAGAVIGESGSTGNSTGPHLHFELRKGGVPVDPAQFMAPVQAEPGQAAGDTEKHAQAGIPVAGLHFRVAVEALNVRSGAGTGSPVVDQLPRGAQVEVLRLHANPVWAELADGRFCALQIGTDVFLEPVE